MFEIWCKDTTNFPNCKRVWEITCIFCKLFDKLAFLRLLVRGDVSVRKVEGWLTVKGKSACEEIETYEEGESLVGETGLCFLRYGKLRTTGGDGFEGMNVRCENEVTH